MSLRVEISHPNKQGVEVLYFDKYGEMSFDGGGKTSERLLISPGDEEPSVSYVTEKGKASGLVFYTDSTTRRVEFSDGRVFVFSHRDPRE
ncbi:MAG TPA: hypothetical protein VLH19_01375 [Patescibacteria group bacterium]|nr:hypothetical protein [Patescibacteria group bacterium]